jgi:hypothetical protein
MKITALIIVILLAAFFAYQYTTGQNGPFSIFSQTATISASV